MEKASRIEHDRDAGTGPRNDGDGAQRQIYRQRQHADKPVLSMRVWQLTAQHLSGMKRVPVEELGVPIFAWQMYVSCQVV